MDGSKLAPKMLELLTNREMAVITSYSIHYTKLYDDGNPPVREDWAKCDGRRGFQSGAGRASFRDRRRPAGTIRYRRCAESPGRTLSYNFV